MLTRYCRTFSAPEHADKTILFSTKTGSALLVPASLVNGSALDALPE
jgi:hypothetical protein